MSLGLSTRDDDSDWTATGYACHSVFSLTALVQLFPGMPITMGMLELSQNPVSGSVRMFISFITSIKLGYGMYIGSKLGVWLMDMFNVPNADWGITSPNLPNCPNSGRTDIDLLQILKMFAFIPDVSAAIAALVLGIVANTFARITNSTAIASVLA
ncbi:hypothetical protein HDU76_012243, partial [Blyttiomyces sp. JEL0837]